MTATDAHTGRQRSGRAGERGWSWWAVLKRTVTEFRDDNVTDWAAALTYYGVLSIFPALIALISVVGLLGSSATSSLLDNLRSFTPGPAKDILTNAVTGLSRSQGSSGILFVVVLRLPSGRRAGTWPRSCGRQTRSGTRPKAGRSGRRFRSGSG